MLSKEIVSIKAPRLEQVKKTVDELGIKLSKGPVRKGVRAAASDMRDIARRAVPKLTGRGRRSLGYNVRKMKTDPLGYEGVTGIQKGARNMERFKKRLEKRKKIRGLKRGARNKQKRLRATMTPTYLRYLEGGWNQAIGKGRTGKRAIPARPWLAPAFRANQSRLTFRFQEVFVKEAAPAVAKKVGEA